MTLTLSLLITACGSKTQIEPSIAVEDDEVAAIEEQATDLEKAEADCRADIACDVASDALDSDAHRYGGIKQEYVVKSCKVTIYNDGPIKMVDEKTDQPCNAPIPKNHQFAKAIKTYQENGCTITEYESAGGLQDATMDCSKKK